MITKVVFVIIYLCFMQQITSTSTPATISKQETTSTPTTTSTSETTSTPENTSSKTVSTTAITQTTTTTATPAAKSTSPATTSTTETTSTPTTTLTLENTSTPAVTSTLLATTSTQKTTPTPETTSKTTITSTPAATSPPLETTLTSETTSDMTATTSMPENSSTPAATSTSPAATSTSLGTTSTQTTTSTPAATSSPLATTSTQETTSTSENTSTTPAATSPPTTTTSTPAETSPPTTTTSTPAETSPPPTTTSTPAATFPPMATTSTQETTSTQTTTFTSATTSTSENTSTPAATLSPLTTTSTPAATSPPPTTTSTPAATSLPSATTSTQETTSTQTTTLTSESTSTQEKSSTPAATLTSPATTSTPTTILTPETSTQTTTLTSEIKLTQAATSPLPSVTTSTQETTSTQVTTSTSESTLTQENLSTPAATSTQETTSTPETTLKMTITPTPETTSTPTIPTPETTSKTTITSTPAATLPPPTTTSTLVATSPPLATTSTPAATSEMMATTSIPEKKSTPATTSPPLATTSTPAATLPPPATTSTKTTILTSATTSTSENISTSTSTASTQTTTPTTETTTTSTMAATSTSLATTSTPTTTAAPETTSETTTTSIQAATSTPAAKSTPQATASTPATTLRSATTSTTENTSTLLTKSTSPATTSTLTATLTPAATSPPPEIKSTPETTSTQTKPQTPTTTSIPITTSRPETTQTPTRTQTPAEATKSTAKLTTNMATTQATSSHGTTGTTDCGWLLQPTNGNITYAQNMTTYGSNATYTCDEGYYINGSQTIHCGASGHWSTNETRCQVKDCQTPKSVRDGFIETPNGTEFGAVADISCNPGYTLHGDNFTKCMADGSWDTYSVNCTLNDCDNVTNVPTNGYVDQTNGTTYLSVSTFRCDIGYTLYGDNTTVCTEEGKWTAYNVTCIINDCGDPPKAPANGTLASQGTTYQSVVSYSCNAGFDLEGNASATCQANKTWTTGPTNCRIKDCGKPNDTAHGTVSQETGHVFKHNVTYKCNEGYETSDATFITCNSSGEWNRPPPICKEIHLCKTINQNILNNDDCWNNECSNGALQCANINECDRYTANCHRRADCNNTDGSYWCKCQIGFTDISGGKGTNCEDIDECSSASTNNCNKDGSQCINYPGGFLCLCDDGWTGDNCSIDIDECNTTGCGVRANCTNYDGGYNCTCNSGYPKGDPKIHCYENVIIDLETRVDPFRGNDELIDAKPIHYRFPYYGYEYNSYRPNMNGFLTLGYQPVYEHYGPETPADWKKYSRGNTVIAPFWTDIDSTNLTGGLYVHLFENYTNYGQNDSQHKDLSRLGKIFTEYYNLTDFRPRVAIVATWINVTQSSYIVPSRLIRKHNATMQVILISDGIYSYVMFNYDHEQWSFEIDGKIPSSAGFSQSDNTGYIIATSKNFTHLNNDTNVNEGTNHIDGRWIYNVSSNDINRNAVLRNESECLEFSRNKTIKDWITKQRELSYPCPCSEQQMQLDYSYRKVDPMYENKQAKTVCYEAWFFNNDGVKQTCCYSYGALKKENIGGGFATFEHDKYNTTQYFYKCCDAKTDRHLCHLFYEMNPPDDCSKFQPADEPIGRYRGSLIGYMRGGTDQI